MQFEVCGGYRTTEADERIDSLVGFLFLGGDVVGRILKPESWEGWEPWTALAMAVTIQAYQDLAKGAWHARTIIRRGKEAKDAVRAFKACKAVTAARYFLESDLWRILSKSRSGWTPQRIQRYIQLVLEADKILGNGRGKKRGSRKQGGRTGH